MIRLCVAVARPDPPFAASLPWWGSLVWFIGERMQISDDPIIWGQRMEPSPGGTNLLAKS